MEVKRNQMSHINLNNNKQTNLIQPLLTISKASTPVRTRIIGGNSQMNSTPINIHKINPQIHKSPNNKENFQSNYIKVEGGMKNFVSQEPDNRINLSPILALNRKMNEGPKPLQKKSLTPQGHKLAEQYNDYDNCPMLNSGNNNFDKNYQTLNGSKGFSGFNQTTNFSNLRGSNSFKNLIQARCKTPNRFATNGINKKDTPLLKQSMSSNQLFKNVGRDSKVRLAESRSFDKFKPLSNMNNDQYQIKCNNNDGKKAKYRVANHDNQGECSEMNLYYCSKCTIPLVQQGFIVEQLGKDNQRDEFFEDKNNRWNDYRFKLEHKKSTLEFIIDDLKKRQQAEMYQLNSYYNRVLKFIQSQRNNDRRRIEQYYEEKINIPTQYCSEIDHFIQTYGEQPINHQKNLRQNQQIQRMLQINEKELLPDHQIINSDILFNNFAQNYEQNSKINLQTSTSTNQTAPHHNQSINNRNHAMRFSFQKLLTDIHHKKSKMQSIMNPLEEMDEQDLEYEGPEAVKQQHTAFRDLFPEGQQAEHFNNIYSPTFKNF